ncbi:UNVERIFIED_CONTAM: hypothetical protein Sradi_1527300 [Sesamum radiatum]|uniref:Uncharacterized protein n=1 Tax=Sesamum radiatum TaxID=300843 RepID=A0AAW2U7D6_SESRA
MAEAEYRSMAATICELNWTYIISNFGISVQLSIQLFCDNQAALHIMANLVFHERTKHIELDCHVARDAYKDGFILPSFVRSSLQLADIFTKALSLKHFTSLLAKLGLAAMHHSSTCGGALVYSTEDGVSDSTVLQIGEEDVTATADVADVVV